MSLTFLENGIKLLNRRRGSLEVISRLLFYCKIMLLMGYDHHRLKGKWEKKTVLDGVASIKDGGKPSIKKRV